MFYWDIANVDGRDFEVERTNVDRVLPVLQCLRHNEGVDIRSVLPVLIVLQRFEPKYTLLYITLHQTVSMQSMQSFHLQGIMITKVWLLFLFMPRTQNITIYTAIYAIVVEFPAKFM